MTAIPAASAASPRGADSSRGLPLGETLLGPIEKRLADSGLRTRGRESNRISS